MTHGVGHWVAGVDEAGRGPLAGPVYAAAVVLPPTYDLPGLADSKVLSERRRLALAAAIRQQAVSWCVARAEVDEIDELNILQASLLAMQRAVEGLTAPPTTALIDGNQAPSLCCQVKTIVKGDAIHPQISAAAILAKVDRDQMMVEADKQYPQYGLARNKGYPTRFHLDALKTHGASPMHRRSFAPVRAAIAQAELSI